MTTNDLYFSNQIPVVEQKTIYTSLNAAIAKMLPQTEHHK